MGDQMEPLEEKVRWTVKPLYIEAEVPGGGKIKAETGEHQLVAQEYLQDKQPRPELLLSEIAKNKGFDKQLRTRDVIDSFLAFKTYKRVKGNTYKTYKKRLNQFERAFTWLPEKPESIMSYLNQFDGETGRHKRNHHDLLHMLYEHAVMNFGWPSNPLDVLDRPIVTKRPIKTLSLEEVREIDNTPDSKRERVCLDLLLGHGWRQVEVSRILAGDVVGIRNGVIWCRGKERDEWTPILHETEERLKELARGLKPEDHVILANRIRSGQREPLGEDGMAQLVARLCARAGISGITGHDLRRSFATLVATASNDEFIAMRLIRDKIPGQNDRYIKFPMPQLREALERYSPLRLIKQKGTGSGLSHEPADSLVETGENRTPRPAEAPQNILQA